MTEEYVPETQPGGTTFDVDVGTILEAFYAHEPTEVLRYDRANLSNAERELMLTEWGYIPPEVRMWTYFTIDTMRTTNGVESLTDVELFLSAFAPNDTWATEAVKDDPEINQYWYNQNVAYRGSAPDKGKMLLGGAGLEGETHLERVASDVPSGMMNWLSPLMSFASDHGGGVTVDPRMRLAEGRNIVDGATYQDMGRIETMQDGFDNFNGAIDDSRKAFAGIVAVSFFGRQALVAAPGLLQNGSKWVQRLLAAPTTQSILQWNRAQMPLATKSNGMSAIKYVSYRTGMGVDQILTRAAGSEAWMAPLWQSTGGRAALTGAGIIGTGLFVDTLNQVFGGQSFDEIQEEQEKVNEHRERLEELDKQKREATTPDELDAVNKAILELGEGPLALPSEQIAYEPMAISQLEDSATRGFAELQLQTDKESKQVNDSNFIASLFRLAAQPATTAVGGTPGGGEPSAEQQEDDAQYAEFGPYGPGPKPEEQEIIDGVAEGTVLAEETEIWLTDLQRRTNDAIDFFGGQWMPEGVSPGSPEYSDILQEVVDKGQVFIENISDPSTGDRRTIILPPQVSGQEFWTKVNEIGEADKDPFLRVSDDYRAYRWKANTRMTGQMDIHEREMLSQYPQRRNAFQGADFNFYDSQMPLWEFDGYVEPRYRESDVEDLMASMGPMQVFKFQQLAQDAGFYESGGLGRFGDAKYPGHITMEDQQIIAIVMGQANVGDAHIGTTFWQVLDHWAEVGLTQKNNLTDDDTGRTKAPFSVPVSLRHIPGPKTIAEETKARFANEMGREARPDELQDMANNLTGYHETSNREQIALYLAAYNGDNQGLLTGGQLQRIEEPGAATTFDIKDEWANEIDLNKRRESNSQSFARMLNATLGGRASVGNASAAGNVTQVGRN